MLWRGLVLTRERLRFFSSSSPLLLFKQPRLSFTFVLSPIPSPVTIFWTCLWQVLRIGAQFQKRAFKTVLRCYSPGSFEFGPVVSWRQGNKNGESLFLCPSHVFTFGSNSQCLLPRSGLNVNLEYRDRSCRFSFNWQRYEIKLHSHGSKQWKQVTHSSLASTLRMRTTISLGGSPIKSALYCRGGCKLPL